MTVTEYLDKRDRLINTPFIIDAQGNGFYVINGERVDKRSFERENALPDSLVLNNCENSDKTKDWLRA